jgi:hypothetical protein
MSLENFKLPKTPESRTPAMLLLIVLIGGVTALVRGFVEFRFAAELVVVGAIAAIGYAVWRFIRGPASS